MARSSFVVAAPALLALPLALLAVTGGCSRNDPPPVTAMAGPTGLAVGGPARDKIFVAMRGLDAVQVVDATTRLDQIDFVRAPARYFPLNLPVGPNPTTLASSADGNYVFVLDALTSQVRAIDAAALEVLSAADGTPAQAAVGPREALASAMVGHPWATCVPSEAGTAADAHEACLGRAYVALQALGAVAAVDVRQPQGGGAPQLRLDKLYAVGGAPTALAAHPTLPVLYVGDAAGQQVLRLALSNPNDVAGADAAATPTAVGVTQRLDVGGVPAALAVSGDGSVLAVGRSDSADLLLVAAAEADAKPAAALAYARLAIAPQATGVAPLPTCLAACGEVEGDGACDDVRHPADAALCVAPEGGYREVPGRRYDGVWLGTQPQALHALSQAQLNEVVTVGCAVAPDDVKQYAEAFVVAGLDGSVQLVGLQGARGAAQLLDAAFCQRPRLDVGEAGAADGEGSAHQAALAAVLAPLDAAVPTDGRALALPLTAGGPAQVGLFRGVGVERSVGLVWEGVLPGADRPAGSGAIDAQGRFYEVVDGRDMLADVALVGQSRDKFGSVRGLGDVLELLTPSVDDAACGGRYAGQARLCALERRIVAVEEEAGVRRLVLDAPLRADCFRAPIAYRVRAGDAFLAGPLGRNNAFAAAPTRLVPGASYGPGQGAAASEALFFRVAADLPSGNHHEACVRYTDGRPGAGAPAWRSRVGMLQLRVTDPYAPLQLARRQGDVDASERIGALPYGLAVSPGVGAAGGPAAARLWVSFAASGGLFVTEAFDGRRAGIGGHGRLLQ